ncbi:MAG: class I SAM-dependent methyltransferase [Acidobacteriota bacterium]|nr:class I SAM-dependent methyltransferase [Acidobacteriota bacterium]
MKKTAPSPAGIQSDPAALARIYARQFCELAATRRHIFSRLPLRRVGTIFEPGCGTGLLAGELTALSDARYTGMDSDSRILPAGDMFIAGDALRSLPGADLYVTSFFFAGVANPLSWLRRARRKLSPGGLFAVFAEYDYAATKIHPDHGIKEKLLSGLREAGLNTAHGGKLDRFFRYSGFEKIDGGIVRTTSRVPDIEFLTMYLEELPGPLPQVEWRIVWGIWRK